MVAHHHLLAYLAGHCHLLLALDHIVAIVVIELLISEFLLLLIPDLESYIRAPIFLKRDPLLILTLNTLLLILSFPGFYLS